MIKILKNLTKREWLFMLAVIVLTCAQTYLDLTLPDYMSEITLLVQTEGSQINDIYIAGGKMIACALGSLSLAVIVAIISSAIASNFSFYTRSKLFNKVMSFRQKEINSFSTSSLITRTTNDITNVQMLIVMGTQMLIKAPVTAIWAMIKMLGKGTQWTIATAVAVVVLMSVVGTVLALVTAKFKKAQILTDNLNRVTRENLDGLNVIRAYNAEEYQGEKFKKTNEELTANNIFIGRSMACLMPTIQVVNNSLVLSVYLIGAMLINEAIGTNKIEIFSDMVVFSAYAMQVILSFMMLAMVFMILPRASVSAKRINEVLDTSESVKEGNKENIENGIKGKVEFKNVSFKYPDGEGNVVENITFTANKGETVALIGSTGCGKSTIINLIPRFYDVTDGEILLNGVNVKEYTSKGLNNLIGYVSQKATLFSGTVKSNVMFGDSKYDDKNLADSIDTAQAKDFVENLEEKYEAPIAQGGGNLSGGQKQRMSIARAIYKKPEILIFDDSFSALDYKTDRKLRTKLNEKCNESTRIIVGQRIGTIKDADKIIVIDDGKIVGLGKHFDLLADCEVYKQIALSQLSEEELKDGKK